MSQNNKKQIKLVTEIIKNLQQFIDSEETMQEYRAKDTFFTRESPLSFKLTTYLILSNLTNTLATEL